MGKSFRRFGRLGNCTGSNTLYYRIANRKIRCKSRHTLDMIRTGYASVEEIVFPCRHRDVGANDWDEPTDGSVLFTKRQIDLFKKTEPKLYRMLKNK